LGAEYAGIRGHSLPTARDENPRPSCDDAIDRARQRMLANPTSTN
jgi:hypothetical protein